MSAASTRARKARPAAGRPAGAGRETAASRRQDPYRDLKVGDTVLLSAAYIDPVHWWIGTVLWIADGRQELLVHQGGIAGQSPHNQLHALDYVRGFGTLGQCIAIKAEAERVVRDAARQVLEIEDLAADLRRRLQEVFETVAATALRKCGADRAPSPEDVA